MFSKQQVAANQTARATERALAGAGGGAQRKLVKICLSRAAGVIDVDDLEFGVEIDRNTPHFAQPNPGRLHSAERNVRLTTDSWGVDVKDAGVEAIDEPEHRRDVAGIDGGR